MIDWFIWRVYLAQASHRVAVKIQNIGLTAFDFGEVGSSLAFLSPRQPRTDNKDGIHSNYYREFPLGFRVSCAYLPSRELSTVLDGAMKALDMQARVEMTLLHLFHAIVQGNVAACLRFFLHPANLAQFYSVPGNRGIARALAAPVQVHITVPNSSFL